ncbi:MAG: hypothetical protein WCT07_01405 [Candidatus Paceibacterota bacterium]|jgi:hypothetical protein
MNRRLTLLVLFTSIFAIGVLIWYFFFYTPKTAETLAKTTSPLEVRTTPPLFGFITNYFTDGQPQQTTSTEVTPAEEQALTQVWDKPSTGNVFVSIPTINEITSTSSKIIKGKATEVVTKKNVRATSTVLMFVDRTTGYVYGHSMETGITYQISNTTITGVYDAYIFNNGKRILVRNLDSNGETIITTLANIPSIKENDNPLPLSSVIALPNNIKSVAVSSSYDKLSYLIASNGGSSVYTITSKGTSLTAVSSFSEWVLSYGGEQLYATSKPSAYVDGSTVLLPSFTRIIGNKTGLLSNPSSNGTIINSMWSQTGLTTFLFSNGGTFSILPIKTVASKCSWNNNLILLICAAPLSIPRTTEGLPDDWYQGRISFSDELSFVNPKNGEIYPLYSFDSKLGGFDVVNLKVSLDNIYVSFINKVTGSVWLLKTDLI